MESDCFSPFLDARIAKIASANSTPFYAYDCNAIVARVRKIKSVLSYPNAKLFFATMANDLEALLQLLARQGVGACVNSRKHLELALKCGIPVKDIQFTSSGITRCDIEYLASRGITVNLDSLGQVDLWCESAPHAGVGIRINAGSLTGNITLADRLGISAAEIGVVSDHAKMRGSYINGLHVYAGTNFQSVEEIMPTLRKFFALAKTINTLDYVNIGGGIGIDYKRSGNNFDISRFGSEVSALAHELARTIGRQIELIFEPGRGLIGTCGVFIARVTDTKVLNQKRFVSTDASIAIFPRPFHHPDSPHRVRCLNDKGECETPKEEIWIVGRTTFSKDVLAQCFVPEVPGIGDLLLFEDAGAYSQSMITRFLGQMEPEAHLLM
jgi:diaminopimelate decarboxylase